MRLRALAIVLPSVSSLPPLVEDELFSACGHVDLEIEVGAEAALAAFEYDGFRFGTTGWGFIEYPSFPVDQRVEAGQGLSGSVLR